MAPDERSSVAFAFLAFILVNYSVGFSPQSAPRRSNVMFDDIDPNERAAMVLRRKAYLAELEAQVAYNKALESGSRARESFERRRDTARAASAQVDALTRGFGDRNDASAMRSPSHARRSPVSSGAHFRSAPDAETEARRRANAAKYKFELDEQIAMQKAGKQAVNMEARTSPGRVSELRASAEVEEVVGRRRATQSPASASRTVNDVKYDDDGENTFVEESRFIAISPSPSPAPLAKGARSPLAPIVAKALVAEQPIPRASVKSMARMWQQLAPASQRAPPPPPTIKKL